MLAPNQVSAPAAIHTSTIPPKLGTARLTSDGCTKIELPTIVPTTIATACTRPIERVSFMKAERYSLYSRPNVVRCRVVRHLGGGHAETVGGHRGRGIPRFEFRKPGHPGNVVHRIRSV